MMMAVVITTVRAKDSNYNNETISKRIQVKIVIITVTVKIVITMMTETSSNN